MNKQAYKQAITVLAQHIAEQTFEENLCDIEDEMSKQDKRDVLLDQLGPEHAFYGSLDDISGDIDLVAQKVYKRLVREYLAKVSKKK